MPKCSLEMTVGAYANPSTFSSQAVNSALSDTWSTNNMLTRDAQDLSAESTEPLGSRNIKRNNEFKCGWKNCTSSGGFASKSSLMRHIESLHVSPRGFACPHCRKSFNRKDQLQAHRSIVHVGRD
ncbi:Zinc finger C2H2-type/integrase DNA-binding domain [Penicillium roqueforti FM164]|uniref:Zinc finger C2H2-type/integrase DNA-binding domain n=1 Tax=Penicillium roqueforti (strain FM164) TaxID=1365484 RepID=W6QMV3_PENRF|nr:Zinc finger C2H2-type/integrase DNA-binding domain [Penicillium roqueforti FM164]